MHSSKTFSAQERARAVAGEVAVGVGRFRLAAAGPFVQFAADAREGRLGVLVATPAARGAGAVPVAGGAGEGGAAPALVEEAVELRPPAARDPEGGAECEPHFLRVADVDEAEGGGAVDLVAEADGYSGVAELSGEAGQVCDELALRGRGHGGHQRACPGAAAAMAASRPANCRRAGISRRQRPQAGSRHPPHGSG